MKNNKYGVVIVEPSELLATGLGEVIGSSPKFSLEGVYSDIGSYEEHARTNRDADLVIVNPLLVCYGKRGALKILFPDMRVVAMLSGYVDRETLAQFSETVDLYDKPSRILHKLEQVVAQRDGELSSPEVGELSDREKEILIAVAKGLINKEIAELYHISIHTVISHRKNISRKTGIKSVSGFGVYALLNNLIEDYEIQ